MTRVNICTLRDPRWQDILEACVEAFELSAQGTLMRCTLEQLVDYCNIKAGGTDRDEVWKILWCVSNLQLRYAPKLDALTWNGKIFQDKSWAWEIRKDRNGDTQPEQITEE